MLVGGDLGLGILVAAFLGLIGPLLGFLVRRNWRHAVTMREEIDWLLVLASKATMAEFEVTGEAIVEVEKAFQELLSAKATGNAIPDFEAKKRVEDYWKPGIGWDLDALTDKLPVHVFELLQIYNLNYNASEEDEIYRGMESSGVFTVSSAYNATIESPERLQDRVVWERIWKLKTPHKMLTLLWMLKHEWVMCNVERKRREFTSYAYCDKCRDKEEDVDHVFRRATSNTNMIVIGAHCSPLLSGGCGDGEIMQSSTMRNGKWNARSVGFFSKRGRLKQPSPRTTILTVHGLCQTRVSYIDHHLKRAETIQGHGWEALAAELRRITPQKENAVLSIVHLRAWEKGVRKVCIQSDSRDAVQWINGDFEILGPSRDIVHACKDWVQRNWVVKITHIHRDHNRVTDRLARIAVREGRDWIEFDAPPNDAREYYEEDRLGALAHNVLF
nr:putative reverse transcriptase zinc-binding domain-containing protein [Ipomoea batatas]